MDLSQLTTLTEFQIAFLIGISAVFIGGLLVIFGGIAFSYDWAFLSGSLLFGAGFLCVVITAVVKDVRHPKPDPRISCIERGGTYSEDGNGNYVGCYGIMEVPKKQEELKKSFSFSANRERINFTRSNDSVSLNPRGAEYA